MKTLVLSLPNERAEKLELVEALIIQNELVLSMLKLLPSKSLKDDFHETSKEIDKLLNEVSEIDKRHELLSENIFLS